MSNNKSCVVDIDYFELVINNAFYFLDKSIRDIYESPKGSIVDLCVSVELFLKAKLIKSSGIQEILIGSKSAQSDVKGDGKFDGESKTISFTKCIKKINSMPHSGTLVDFEELASLRNKIIHFAHEDYHSDKVEVGLVYWKVIWKLTSLFGEWGDDFKSEKERIDKVRVELLKKRKFLNEVYEKNKLDIDSESERGGEVFGCNNCGFNAVFYLETKYFDTEYPIDNGEEEISSFEVVYYKCAVCECITENADMYDGCGIGLVDVLEYSRLKIKPKWKIIPRKIGKPDNTEGEIANEPCDL